MAKPPIDFTIHTANIKVNMAKPPIYFTLHKTNLKVNMAKPTTDFYTPILVTNIFKYIKYG